MNAAGPTLLYPPIELATPRRIRAVLAALALWGAAYFHTGGGASQQAHYMTTRALLTQRTFALNSFPFVSVDVARVDGKTYSNKPPGFPIIMLPAAMFGLVVEKAWPGRAGTALQVGALVTQTLLLGGAGLCILWLLEAFFRREGAGRHGPMLAALVYLGTYLWPFSTTFFSHLVTAALGLWPAVTLWQAQRQARGLTASEATGVGLLLSLAVVTEYSAAVAFLPLGAWALWRAHGWRERIRLAAGAVIPVAALLAWQWALFGSPLSFSYAHVSTGHQVEGHAQGFLGASWPNGRRLWELTVGTYRGLFVLNPVLLLAVLGLWKLSRTPGSVVRGGAITMLVATVAMLLFISGYWAWEGGSSFGPRFLVPLIPLLALGLAKAVRRWPGWTLGLAALGIPGMLTGPAVCMIPHAAHGATYNLVSYLGARLLAGKVPAYAEQIAGEAMLAPDQQPTLGLAFNLGHVMGLHGAATVVPFLMGCAFLLAYLVEPRR